MRRDTTSIRRPAPTGTPGRMSKLAWTPEARAMKPAIAVVALILSACGGSTAGPITEPPIGKPPADADSCAVARPDFGTATAAERNLFAYQVNAPLKLQMTVEATTNGVQQSGISFESPAGGRVNGVLLNPVTRSSLRPGIVLMHGMPGNARVMLPYAHSLAQLGAVVIAIDAPFARRDGPSMRFTTQDHDEQIQLMKDLQRAVDVLRAQPNVDADRIAYVGFSYGGAMGVLFAGIERRIKTAVLVVADGGIVSHYTGKEDFGFLTSLGCAKRVAWFRAMAPIEPIRFIGLATPTPLLLQSGRTDDLVPAADARVVHDAAPEPKTVIWYDAGHGLNQQASLDRQNWLAEKIGLDH